MCGIYGWQWNPKSPPADWRKAIIAVMLGRFNARRGNHSWGMYAPTLGIRKGLGSIERVSHKGINFGTFMAHTRFATTGAKTKENSHPFKVGNIVGAHNGMIRNHEELGRKYDRKYEVDSEHIFHHLSEGLPMSELEGYGTAEWVDLRDKKRINIAKLTDSGDLCVAGLPFGTVWSSDKTHLKDVLEMAGLKDKQITIYSVPAGKVHFVEDGQFFIKKDTDVGISGTRTSNITRGYSGYSGPSRSYSYYGGDHDDWGEIQSSSEKLKGYGWKTVVPETGKEDGNWACSLHGRQTVQHMYCEAPRCFTKNPWKLTPEELAVEVQAAMKANTEKEQKEEQKLDEQQQQQQQQEPTPPQRQLQLVENKAVTSDSPHGHEDDWTCLLCGGLNHRLWYWCNTVNCKQTREKNVAAEASLMEELGELDMSKLSDDELVDLWWGGTMNEGRKARVELERRYDEAMKNGTTPPPALLGARRTHVG